MGKKKLKVKRNSSNSLAKASKALVKKSSRILGGKQSGSTSTNSRPTDGETVTTFGVVASEYNIQAQINWLTAPPTTGDKKNNSSALPPPSKKPQRGYHRDLCEACGEAECLMYCDKCPSAYHAICDDPPLPPEDFESIGINWKCKKCRFQARMDAGFEGTEIGISNIGMGGPISKFFNQCLPFQHMQNPVQFKLSKEMPAYDYPFPGTSRHVLKKGRQRTSVVDVENGMVPRPTVLCYHCQRSCRIGALIQCDKCDLFFHLDCLDPPLTTIPATVWICPLHVEPYLESTQLTSIALSERIKIWDNTEKPVNRSAVILNFLRKASRQNPMFRRKIPIPMTSVHEIPEMVQNCYKEDVQYVQEKFGKLHALAAACEIERVKFSMEEEVHKYRTKWIDHYLPAGKSLVEQRARVEFLRARNESKLSHIQNVLKMYDEHVDKPTNTVPELPAPPPKPKLSDLMSGFFKDTSSTTGAATEDITKRRESSSDEKGNIISSTKDEPPTKLPQNETGKELVPLPKNVEKDKLPNWVLEELHAAEADADEDMKAVNDLKKEVRRVGEMLLQFPLTPEAYNDGIASIISYNGMKTCESTLPSTLKFLPTITEPKLQPAESIPLQLDVIKSLPKKIVNKLAACHLRHMRRKKEFQGIRGTSKTVHSIPPSISGTGPRPLISFCIENIGVIVEITRRSFWIGSGNSCDWKITDFIKCNRIEEKHAKIFFNPHENCWEILNYSPYGLYVNNTLFGFKSIDSNTATVASAPERLLELQEMSHKRIDEYIINHSSKLHNVDLNPCYCKPYPTKSMTNVFEGSVKLYEGHKLQIGCAKLTVEKFKTIAD